MFFSNPTSLVNKWDDFNSIVISIGYPQVVGIAETCFKADSRKTLTNYKLFSLEIADGKGGVALYVRQDIEFLNISYINLFPANKFGVKLTLEVSCWM